MSRSYPTCQKSRDPSDPPLAKRPSWIGCQATATTKHHERRQIKQTQLCAHRLKMSVSQFLPVASFLCPLNTCSSSFRLRMSNSLHKWSRDAVSSQLPFRFHFTSITVFLWACLRYKKQQWGHDEIVSALTVDRRHQRFTFHYLYTLGWLTRLWRVQA